MIHNSTDHSHHQSGHEHYDAHSYAAMVEDFRHRFRVSLIVTIPILAPSPLTQQFFGLKQILAFPSDAFLLFLLSSSVFFTGGGCFWPVLCRKYQGESLCRQMQTS